MVVLCHNADCQRESVDQACDRADCPIPRDVGEPPEPSPVEAIEKIVSILTPLKTTDRVRVMRSIGAFLDLRW